MPLSDSTPPTEKKNWLARNWPWLIPTGCLSMLAALALFALSILFLVTASFKSSEPYATALQAASENPSVQEQVGIPLEGKFFPSGSIELKNSNGKANLEIPVSGPKGTATIYVVGTKAAGKWSYSTLLVEIDATNEQIDLK